MTDAQTGPGKRRRSRRLRKKLRIGEFREFGFELAIRLAPNQPMHAEDAFWDRFIVDCIESRGLAFGGADTGYVTRAGRGTVSADDREAVGAWLAQRAEVLAYELRQLEDVWYPSRNDCAETA